MIKRLTVALSAASILLVSCTSIQVSREMPFVKVTVPSASQISPLQQIVNVQGRGNPDYELVLARFEAQERIIQALQADISRMEASYKQRRVQPKPHQMQRPRQRQAYQQPVYRPAKSFPYQVRNQPQPRLKTVVQTHRQAQNNPDCEFLERDLSQPQSTVVYCRPTR